MSGRFYHPDYGFVVVSTQSVFKINSSDDFPSEGVLVAKGSNGSMAQLTVLSSTSLQVEADFDGNGTVDCSSGSFNWTDISSASCL